MSYMFVYPYVEKLQLFRKKNKYNSIMEFKY